MKGMNPYLADQDMKNMKTIKNDLQKLSNDAVTELKNQVTKAFSGSQTEAMQGYINALNDVLLELYSYVDGKNSSFATILNETIASYDKSNSNVQSSYNSN